MNYESANADIWRGDGECRHLPECPMEIHKGECCYDDPLFGFPCWCDTLRACEQRVREEWYEVQSEAWGQGFHYALDKAREAVVALEQYVNIPYESPSPAMNGEQGEWVWRSHALAAIDALKEKR